MNIYCKILFVLLLVLGFGPLHAKQCQLMPRDFDGSARSVSQFEKNLEKQMSAIYQKERPRLRSLLQRAAQLEDEMLSLQSHMISKNYPGNGGRFRTDPGGRARELRRIRKMVLSVVTKEEVTEADVALLNAELDLRKDFNWDQLETYRQELLKIKEEFFAIDEKIQNLKEPKFIGKPKVKMKIRGGGMTYGDVQFEAFLRPPKDDMLKIPFLKAGFKMDDTTIVYACINFDGSNTKDSAIYIYFLNTTKFIAVRWYDYIVNYNLTIREILTFWQEPKAKVHPITLTSASIFGPVQFLTSNFAILKPFEFLNDFLQSINFIGASMTPVQSFIFDNFGVGITSVHIEPKNIKLKYAVSTMFDLIRFDLINQNVKGENSFLGVLGHNSFQKPLVLDDDKD